MNFTSLLRSYWPEKRTENHDATLLAEQIMNCVHNVSGSLLTGDTVTNRAIFLSYAPTRADQRVGEITILSPDLRYPPKEGKKVTKPLRLRELQSILDSAGYNVTITVEGSPNQRRRHASGEVIHGMDTLIYVAHIKKLVGDRLSSM